MSPVPVGPAGLAVGVTALIPAAGAGRRVGAPVPKQLLPLAGLPVLVHTLRIFQQEPRVDDIVIAAPPDRVEEFWDLVRAHGIGKVTRIVPGGAERQDSVAAALAACTSRPRIVAVHDAARPLLRPDLLAAILDAAAAHPAVVMAVPVRDTVKAVAGGMVRETVPRDGLWLAQTPQVFRAHVLERALRQAQQEGYRGTDCASLVERTGVPVAVFPGAADNLKLTTPEDWALAEAILAARAAAGAAPATGAGAAVAPDAGPALAPGTGGAPAPGAGPAPDGDR